MTPGHIRVGIGGWTYPPWRGVFYPNGLPHARELGYAAERLGTIEINATFYGRQSPASWAKWAAAVPGTFQFAVKGARYCVTRPHLADAGEGIARFLDQGLCVLGPRLGPILWQLRDTRAFDADDIAAFMALLPAEHGGVALRHVIEPRHASFADTAFEAIARDHNVAVVLADDADFPCLDIDTADFRYVRLQRSGDDAPAGYDARALDHWADVARGWADASRDVYCYVIGGAKVHNPAAATALIAQLAH